MAQVLDSSGQGSAAVRLALGETQLVTETQEFLQEQGVRLDAFSRPAAERSKTVILAKNLPAHTDPAQLREMFGRHGELGRVVLPPSGVTGQSVVSVTGHRSAVPGVRRCCCHTVTGHPPS